MPSFISHPDLDFTVLPVGTRAEHKAFLELPNRLYKDDPHWVTPLRYERADQLNPQKNPGLKNLDVQLFIAKRNRQTIGRVAAIRNHTHLEIHQDNTGHFGFLDAEDNPPLIHALLQAAQDWIKDQGLTRMLGPSHFSVNEEIGLLIDGFDSPPMVMMPHGRSDYQFAFESFGLTKAMDIYAYISHLDDAYPRPSIIRKLFDYYDKIALREGLVIRSMRPKKFAQDVKTAMAIFNNAWEHNWGFVPFSDAQIQHMAHVLKPILTRDLFWVCEHKGVPIAFALMIPNINEGIKGLNGRLLPFGFLKLLYRLKVKGLKTIRLPLMGIHQDYQNTRMGTAISTTLSQKVFSKARDRGYRHLEMSWILEANKSMRSIIENANGSIYKTYRMYEKSLAEE